MINFTAELVYYLNSAIYGWLIYHSLRQILKLKVKTWVAVAWFVAYVAFGTQQFLVFENFWMNVSINIASIMLLTLLYHGKNSIKLLFALLVYASSFISDVLVFTFASGYLQAHGIEVDMNIKISILRSIISMVNIPIVFGLTEIFRRYVIKKYQNDVIEVPIVHVLLMLFSFVGILIADLMVNQALINNEKTGYFQLLIVQPIFCLITISLVVFYGQTISYLKEQKDSRQKDVLLKQWQGQYETVLQEQRLEAEQRHNMKYRYLTIKNFLQGHQVGLAEEFVDKQIGVLQTVNAKVKTGNITLDTLFQHYVQQAEKQLEIEIKVHALLTEQLKIDPVMINMVLGNAMENAIEACQKLPKDERFIKVDARMRSVEGRQDLIIDIYNSYAQAPVVGKKGIFKTVKADQSNHGMGLASMVEALPPEKGVIHVDYHNGEFHFSLLMYG